MRYGKYLAVFLLALGACAPSTGLGEGDLAIRIGEAGRSIVPTVNSATFYFIISGTGPATGASFSERFPPGGEGSLLEKSLMLGTWTITADSYNSADERIGTGSVQAGILPGRTTAVTVQVEPLAENGTLSLTLDWTGTGLSSPTVAASICPVGGSSETLSFVPGLDSATCTRNDLPAGSYYFQVQLYDGTSLLWGTADSVLIVAGKTSQATIIPRNIAM